MNTIINEYKVEQEFTDELKALLKKYNANLEIAKRGYYNDDFIMEVETRQ